jgi:hypothetical protein
MPIQGLINGLRHNVHFRLSRKIRAQTLADLAGAPALYQAFAHDVRSSGLPAIFPVR